MNAQKSESQEKKAPEVLDARTQRMVEEEFKKFARIRKNILERVKQGRKLYEEELAKPDWQKRDKNGALLDEWESRLNEACPLSEKRGKSGRSSDQGGTPRFLFGDFPESGHFSSASGDTYQNQFELIIDRGNPFPFKESPSGRSRISEYGWEEKDIAVFFQVDQKTINRKLKLIEQRWPELFNKLVLSRKIAGKRISRQYHEDIFLLILHYDELAYLKKILYPPANYVNGKPVPVPDEKKKQLVRFWKDLKEREKTSTPQ